MDKVLSVLDVVLTPLAGIVSPKVRKAVYASLPVVLAVLGALVGTGIFSGQVAVIVGGIYSALSGLLAAANTTTTKPIVVKPAAPVVPPAK
jgi:predicted Co/Zn/Cd cation transporter (cation efflux family)